MLTLEFTTKLTDAFFDRAEVVKKLDDAERRQLNRIGAYIRRGVLWSLRRRKKPSAAGSPPSVHTRDKFGTLKNVSFVYDPKAQSVIVGPVRSRIALVDGKTVPQIHEFGARVRIKQQQYKDDPDSVWRSVVSNKERPWLRYRFASVNYPKRSFMRPVLDRPQTQAMILSQWRGVVSS